MAALMLDCLLALPVLAALTPPGAPQSRFWLDHMAALAPAGWATRSLLLGDILVLILMALRLPRPVIAVPVGLGGGFLALNALGMILTDFFLGLLAFHWLVAAAALCTRGLTRWAGVGLLAVTITLGLAT